MEWLWFLFHRTFQAQKIAKYSSNLDGLNDDLAGRDVAIVGNSRALAHENFGFSQT